MKTFLDDEINKLQKRMYTLQMFNQMIKCNGITGDDPIDYYADTLEDDAWTVKSITMALRINK